MIRYTAGVLGGIALITAALSLWLLHVDHQVHGHR